MEQLNGEPHVHCDDATYFASYADLSVHRLMLSDEPRCHAYQEALLANKDWIQNKTVMDVGAGSGFLAILAAKYGARRVFAVEASQKLQHVIERLAIDNKVAERVVVVPYAVEEIRSLEDLWAFPTVAERVLLRYRSEHEQHVSDVSSEGIRLKNQKTMASRMDMIVSEWMGFYLLHESMLDSVLVARDRFLKRPEDGGRLFPSTASLYLSLCSDNAMWKDVVERWEAGMYGLQFQCLAANQEERPVIRHCSPESISVASTATVFTLDLWSTTPQELQSLSRDVSVTMLCDATLIHGFIFWFDVAFPGSDVVVLRTGPRDPPTHWKQVIALLSEPMPARNNYVLQCRVQLDKTSDHRRHYQIAVDVMDVTRVGE